MSSIIPKRLSLLTAVALALAPPFARSADVAAPASAMAKKPLVQIALLLDTSGSMSGLIDQARSQLWKVVNELATARRDGVRPDLRIALYEYGNDGLSAAGNWIRQITPFTDDLDLVSERLFALGTNGGQEYCGAVIERAVEDLAWSSAPADLKLVFIAGNEPFTQGPIDFRAAVKKAATKGITVNTIHCGSEADGIAGGWRDGALLADGGFTVIDHDRVAADPPTPLDAELARLNAELNRTYVAYGAVGREKGARQAAQDVNAARMSAGALASRTSAKASASYRNSEWDLVDAAKDGVVKVEEVAPADLPEPMRAMGATERKAYVEQKAKERAELQARIAAVSKARDEVLAAERTKQAAAAPGTLDAAMSKAVRAQAARNRYTFE